MPRHLSIVVFPDFQILDATGPLAAFEIAARLAPGAYEIALESADAGPVASSSGVQLVAAPLSTTPPDTVMIAGGNGTRPPEGHVRLIDWVRRAAGASRRITSVCTGAFILAEAGLLEGRRATTHWGQSDRFAARYPKVSVEADRIWVRDGHIWTSAGITAGIDLALALIEDDLGLEIARKTAQQLVVHHRRPGGQSQFSSLPDTGGLNGRFAGLLDWMRARLREPLGVERLASQAAMSPRHFARAFTAETGVTPAKAVERLRLEAARLQVESTHEPIDRIAEAVGFHDPERMRRAFIRAFGQPPQALRRAAKP